jgi:hypothetical protein
VPHYRWFLVQGIDDLGGVVGDLLQGLLGEDVRVRPGLFNRCRIVWPVRRQRRVAGLLEEVRPVGSAARQQPRPWTKTTGVVPEALAAWISRLSRSEIDAMTNSPPVG